jgi:hypothetical protein
MAQKKSIKVSSEKGPKYFELTKPKRLEGAAKAKEISKEKYDKKK